MAVINVLSVVRECRYLFSSLDLGYVNDNSHVVAMVVD